MPRHSWGGTGRSAQIIEMLFRRIEHRCCSEVSKLSKATYPRHQITPPKEFTRFVRASIPLHCLFRKPPLVNASPSPPKAFAYGSAPHRHQTEERRAEERS
ncbi:uncharacterized protein LAJ45_06486 [Morchella importuna]|uniref:uncharacterized protein n=1 Tax=Morchella importuna TaxID=1174673 RepID=UPI001E8CE45E|nr:uncharacterized protein LAJ45_06486 [Morchella importuna]KAH8149407.1 hypothetical protein LAJ45_06486 [Morchella importuna]